MSGKHHVIITNPKHPHHCRRGYIPVVDGMVTVAQNVLGHRMVRVEFTDGDTTTSDAAFAYPGDFQPDPHAPGGVPAPLPPKETT